MTNKQPNTRAGEAQARQLATALMSVERFTADGNFHPDYLAMLTHPLPQPSELVERLREHYEDCRTGARVRKAYETLCHEADLAAARITQLEAQIAKLQADGDKLAGALEAFQRHYDLNDCDERCGALEVPISDLRRACQALVEGKDRA